MKFVILLAMVAGASAAIYCNTVDAGAGVVSALPDCAQYGDKKIDGSAAVGGTASCSCGTDKQAAAKDKFCTVLSDANTKKGLVTTGAIIACADDFTNGKTAVTAEAGCLCGTSQAVAAKGSYCNTVDAGAGVVSTLPDCAQYGDKKIDGSAAVGGAASCSCGTDKQAAAKEKFCTVLSDANTKKGLVTNSAIIACADDFTNGKTAVTAAAGCLCGTSQAVAKVTLAPTNSPTKAPTNATTGGGGATAAITVKQEVKFGIAKTAYTGDVQILVERSYGLATKICTGNCTAWSTGYSLASAAARRASCTVTFTTTCADKTKSAAAATAAKAITATSMKSQMDTLKTQAGLAGAVPAVSSVAAPKDSAAVVAAASTNGVSIGLAFTALCLAVTALRQ